MNTIKVIFIGAVVLYVFVGTMIYFFQERLIFLPEELPQEFEFSFKYEFDEHFLTTPNDGNINLLYFKSQDPKGLIVYFHGNAGSLRRWGEVISPFVDLGYEVIISDYRGYGKSTGARSQENLLADAEAVYAFAKEIVPESKIILFGRSLGTGFASFLAGKSSPSKVILETPFYNLNDIARRRFLIFPSRWFLKYQLESNKYLKSAEAPIYFFHGTDDEIVAYESGKKLYESLPEYQGKLFTINGGAHNNLHSFESYWNHMKKVLSE